MCNIFQKPCKHNPIIVAITTGECHHSGSIILNIQILLIKVIHHLQLRMIFPASLLVISQAMAIHLSLVITCFIFHNLILNLYFLAVGHHYGMSLTSVQGMRYPMPRPSLSTPLHKTPVSASIIPQSAHQRYQHQGMSSTSVQGILYPTPTPSPSPVHKFHTSASLIPQSAHQRYHHKIQPVIPG